MTNVKCQNVPWRRVSHARCFFFVSGCAKPSRKTLLKGLTSTVKLTNHRVYQELVYRNEVLKTMLASSNYSSLPSSPEVFAQLLSMRFPDYLGTVYVKREKVRFSSHFRHPSSLDDVVSVLKLPSGNKKQPNFGWGGLGKVPDCFVFRNK